MTEANLKVNAYLKAILQQNPEKPKLLEYFVEGAQAETKHN